MATPVSCHHPGASGSLRFRCVSGPASRAADRRPRGRRLRRRRRPARPPRRGARETPAERRSRQSTRRRPAKPPTEQPKSRPATATRRPGTRSRPRWCPPPAATASRAAPADRRPDARARRRARLVGGRDRARGTRARPAPARRPRWSTSARCTPYAASSPAPTARASRPGRSSQFADAVGWRAEQVLPPGATTARSGWTTPQGGRPAGGGRDRARGGHYRLTYGSRAPTPPDRHRAQGRWLTIVEIPPTATTTRRTGTPPARRAPDRRDLRLAQPGVVLPAATTRSKMSCERGPPAGSRRSTLGAGPAGPRSRRAGPSPRADVHPVPAVPGLVGGVAVVVLAAEHQPEPRSPRCRSAAPGGPCPGGSSS